MSTVQAGTLAMGTSGCLFHVSDMELCAASGAAYRMSPTWASGDVHAVAMDMRGALVVAFRGTTADPRDWIRDIDFWPRRHPSLGWCPDGFLSGAEAIWEVCQAALRGPRVLLTGHSLGGALALLVGAIMAALDRAPAAITTFGAPRVGMHRMRMALRAVSVREFRDGNDPVPCVPWAYQHARTPIAIGHEWADPISAHHVAAYQAAIADEGAR